MIVPESIIYPHLTSRFAFYNQEGGDNMLDVVKVARRNNIDWKGCTKKRVHVGEVLEV